MTSVAVVNLPKSNIHESKAEIRPTKKENSGKREVTVANLGCFPYDCCCCVVVFDEFVGLRGIVSKKVRV